MYVDITSIGNRVKEYRWKNKLKQDDLAWNAEMSVPYLSRVENGKVNISLECLMRLIHALKITPNELLLDDEDRRVSEDLLLISNLVKDCDNDERDVIIGAAYRMAAEMKRMLQEMELRKSGGA